MKAYIPYGAYWSTPFVRWQGSLAHLHALEFVAHVAKAECGRRDIPLTAFDSAMLGTTVPQPSCFFGLPWVTAMMGAPNISGPTIAQACATSARVIANASNEIATGMAQCTLVLTADRISNGPDLLYPNPAGPAGAAIHENWVMDNFKRDPYAHVAMIQTAENVAKRYDISTAEQNAASLRRYEQYADACANDSAFLRRFMTLPFDVPDPTFRKIVKTLAGDEGIHPTTAEGLAKLKPLVEGGTVTFGGQTHPADGNTAAIVTTRERARKLSKRPEIAIEIVATGQARAEKAHMPIAPVPAARQALDRAGLKISDIRAIKTHNPFIVNDIVFAREFGNDVMKMNNYGCSLVWGHPQGPTGLRAILELIEELAMTGGGYGLFTGCAAGDSAMAVIVKVSDGK